MRPCPIQGPGPPLGARSIAPGTGRCEGRRRPSAMWPLAVGPSPVRALFVRCQSRAGECARACSGVGCAWHVRNTLPGTPRPPARTGGCASERAPLASHRVARRDLDRRQAQPPRGSLDRRGHPPMRNTDLRLEGRSSRGHGCGADSRHAAGIPPPRAGTVPASPGVAWVCAGREHRRIRRPSPVSA